MNAQVGELIDDCIDLNLNKIKIFDIHFRIDKFGVALVSQNNICMYAYSFAEQFFRPFNSQQLMRS